MSASENVYEPGKEFNVLKMYLEKCNSTGTFSFKESSEIYSALNNMGRYIEYSVARLNELGGQIDKITDYDKIKIGLITKNLELNNLKNSFNNKVNDFNRLKRLNEGYERVFTEKNLEIPKINDNDDDNENNVTEI